MSDNKELLDRFNNVYKVLYDNDVATNQTLIDAFDKAFEQDEFKERVKEFVKYRGDILSSDREIVAYMLVTNA